MKVMTPTKRLRSAYIYIYNMCMWQIFVLKLWRCCGVVWGTYIFSQWVVVQLKLEELAKVVVNRHLNPEDCSGMTWAESAEGSKIEGLCLIEVEIRHDLKCQ